MAEKNAFCTSHKYIINQFFDALFSGADLKIATPPISDSFFTPQFQLSDPSKRGRLSSFVPPWMRHPRAQVVGDSVVPTCDEDDPEMLGRYRSGHET